MTNKFHRVFFYYIILNVIRKFFKQQILIVFIFRSNATSKIVPRLQHTNFHLAAACTWQNNPSIALIARYNQ